jgi:hypothetical protein
LLDELREAADRLARCVERSVAAASARIEAPVRAGAGSQADRDAARGEAD